MYEQVLLQLQKYKGMQYGLKRGNDKDNYRKHDLQNEDSKLGMSRMVMHMLLEILEQLPCNVKAHLLHSTFVSSKNQVSPSVCTPIVSPQFPQPFFSITFPLMLLHLLAWSFSRAFLACFSFSRCLGFSLHVCMYVCPYHFIPLFITSIYLYL